MAQTYSVEQLISFAESIDAVAEALPIEKAMSKDQAKQLMSLSQALGGAASHIRLIAVQQILAATTVPLAQITEATKSAQQVVKTIKDISKVITLVGHVIVLAQVLATQNWALVRPAFMSLKDDVTPAEGAA